MNLPWILPEAQPKRGEPLGEAYDRIAQACRDAGLSVYEPEQANDESPLRDLVRYFHVAGHGFAPDVYCMVFVSTEAWGHDNAVLFLNTYLNLLLDEALIEQVGRAIFVFRGAYPTEPLLDYIFKDWPAGRLEAAALASLSDEPLTRDSAPMLAVTGRDLLEQHLGHRLELNQMESIGELNDLLLGQLRTCDDPSLALAGNEYRPQGILALLGAVLGEMIRRAHSDRVRWVSPPESLGGSYPVLEVAPAPGQPQETCYIFPIDRLHHCYQEGQDRDLRTYYDVVIAHTLSGHDQHDVTGHERFEDVADHIFPVLKPTDWNARMEIESVPFWPGGPVGTPQAVVAIDHPQRIAFLVRDRLEAWNVSYSELMGRACANLARRSMDMLDHLEELERDGSYRVYRLGYDDYFNASRSLLGESLYRAMHQLVPDAKRFIMAIPNRDHLLLMPYGSREDVERFKGLVRWFHQRQPAPVSSLCFLLGEDGIEGCEGLES